MTECRQESTLRNEDERLMNLISEFLDKNFYNEYAENISRVTDKSRQVAGMDIIFNLKGKDYQYLCDEKSAVRYINKGLNTFSLELSFINRRNEVQEGWLVSNKEENNSFMLIWVNDAESEHPRNINEIHKVDIALVKRSAIMEYLANKGWTVNALKRKCENIRNNPYEYFGNIYRDGFKFSFSQQLVEQPINILISKDTYIKISDFSKTISK